MNEWEELKDKVKRTKYKIYNGQTGKYVCGNDGEIKIFDTKEEVVVYIQQNHLSNIYEIKEYI